MKEKINSFTGEYEFLSNFWPCAVEYKMIRYSSVENAFQASKTLILSEREKFKNITPNKSKRLGTQLMIHGYLRKDWDDVKIIILKNLLKQKFECPELKKLLLKTGNLYIEQDSTCKEKFWDDYQDENILGKLLMEVRQKIFDKKL